METLKFVDFCTTEHKTNTKINLINIDKRRRAPDSSRFLTHFYFYKKIYSKLATVLVSGVDHGSATIFFSLYKFLL